MGGAILVSKIILLLFVCLQISLLDHVLGVKKLNWLKKFMQLEVDVKCMQTQFWGRDLFGFREFALYCFSSKWPNFLFRPWTIVHGGQKIESAQKIHASRGWPETHANQFWWAWPLLFQRFSPLNVCLQNSQNFLSDMDYSPWGSKNRIGSKHWCK